MTEALRAENIVKRFGAVSALAGVSLSPRRGEILGILSDNGAGKSTLMKILTGYETPTSGALFVAGREVALRSVDHARSLGIECVYQDLALVNSLSVYHNMFLNREIVHRGPIRLLNHRAMRRQRRCVPGADRRAHPVGRGTGRAPVGRPATGDSRGARSELRRTHPVA